MRGALAEAALAPGDVEYVSASGSGFRDEDQWESAAMREVFGRAERAPWVTSYKGAAGHHLGAAGAFDVAMTAFGLRAGHMPPIAHHDEPEPGCGLDYVTGSARALERRTALCNTIAESGQCVSVALRAVA
jgi:3-oxoacyl-[acyl-carrier-protein] synthase II